MQVACDAIMCRMGETCCTTASRLSQSRVPRARGVVSTLDAALSAHNTALLLDRCETGATPSGAGGWAGRLCAESRYIEN